MSETRKLAAILVDRIRRFDPPALRNSLKSRADDRIQAFDFNH
jgi:hypothetical protein